MTAEARVQTELFEQSVRGDLIPCVPPDRLEFAVERVVTNPHLRRLVALLRNAEAASARLAEVLAETLERTAAAEGQVQRIKLVRCWTNEDGKQFLFADDVRAALGEPS